MFQFLHWSVQYCEDLVKMSLMSQCQVGGTKVSWTVGFVVVVSCKVLFSPRTLNQRDVSSGPRGLKIRYRESV